MKKKLLSVFLCLCMCIPLLTVMASAAANNIHVDEVDYYEDSGDVAELTVIVIHFVNMNVVGRSGGHYRQHGQAHAKTQKYAQ